MKCPNCNTDFDPMAVAATAPVPPPRPFPVFPVGLKQIIATFGKPGDVPLGKAKVPDTFRRLPYCAGGTITCHKGLVKVVEWVFAEIERRGLADKIKSYDGCYNPRKKRGGTDWSVHAWACALDINAGDNMPGMKNSIDKRVIAIFEEAGFYQLPGDFMHFQWCKGY